MEEALGGQGYRAVDFAGPTTYSKPYRATVLTRLALSLAAAGAPPRVVCETGFGAGHSALLWVALSTGSAPALPLRVTVHSFDHGLANYTLASHDYMDENWPEALVLYLGEGGRAGAHGGRQGSASEHPRACTGGTGRQVLADRCLHPHA